MGSAHRRALDNREASRARADEEFQREAAVAHRIDIERQYHDERGQFLETHVMHQQYAREHLEETQRPPPQQKHPSSDDTLSDGQALQVQRMVMAYLQAMKTKPAPPVQSPMKSPPVDDDKIKDTHVTVPKPEGALQATVCQDAPPPPPTQAASTVPEDDLAASALAIKNQSSAPAARPPKAQKQSETPLLPVPQYRGSNNPTLQMNNQFSALAVKEDGELRIAAHKAANYKRNQSPSQEVPKQPERADRFNKGRSYSPPENSTPSD